MNPSSPPSKYELDEMCSIYVGSKFLEVNLYGGTFDVPTVDRILAKIEKYTFGRKFLTVINCDPSASTTFKAIKRMGKPSAMQYTIAKAYVISTMHQRVMANLYLLLFKPEKPVKFFKSVDAAKEWLSTL